MWKVILVLLQLSSENAIMHNDQIEMPSIEACLEAAGNMLNTIDNDRSSYYVGCRIEPVTPA